ncbi:alkaline phosphatase family protein [Marinomonas mediterranea]|uniref:alkaline phosphatase D family protein n=1 Tax=Marinomonas mediterranea TaxID=119864 RepID=UPI00234B0283|nr:alkaline phosphatase D family protein [Marinomonas mediterranea]WCN12340.1 alkaline phosphatase family protein [Marinomonas mediterranea]
MTSTDTLEESNTQLPAVIAGPILRKLDARSATFWLACSEHFDVHFGFFLGDCFVGHSSNAPNTLVETTQQNHVIKLSESLWIMLVTVEFQAPLQPNTAITYEVTLSKNNANAAGEIPFSDWGKPLCYAQEERPSFVFKPKVDNVLHGSCRKPHHRNAIDSTNVDCGDGLAVADDHLASIMEQVGSVKVDSVKIGSVKADSTKASSVKKWPSALVMSGDQIYADDVAGPILNAIHQVIALLGLPSESLPASDANKTFEALHTRIDLYYQRESVLPMTDLSDQVKKQFFFGGKKPIFTSSTAHNHLMSFSEMVAMYLLVWSPELWPFLNLEAPAELRPETRDQYNHELENINCFVEHLSKARRVMAHLPTAMMFDDHDITDDWNLTAGWEQAAYEHPVSKRIIGNGLMAYFLFQGWGNNPTQFDQAFIKTYQTAIEELGTQTHDDVIQTLIRYDRWHYVWETSPALVVLDTRTHRWRSESNLNKPSGLMDWEALTDLQSELINRDSVLLVSPAPIFGVKLIEAIQKVFTLCGKPLLVDAENWMAHSGSAHTLMNLFRHPKTPKNFVILSGDVHYSFAYHVEVKGQSSSPNVWQITSSGLRNEFPDTLLTWFDRLNRWLYAPWSPLNLFTKRRGMWVAPCKPDKRDKGERLLNGAGIGFVRLDGDGAPKEIAQLLPKGEKVRFLKSDDDRQFE